METSQRLRILLVGHSHSCPVRYGLRLLQERGSEFDFHYLYLHDDRYKPTMDFGTGVLNSAIEQEVRKWVEASPVSDSDWLLLSINGNEHNALGLVANPIPFDFVRPDAPDAPLGEGACCLPYDAMYAAMRARLNCPTDIRIKAFKLAEAIASLHPRKPLWLEPPPPIDNIEHIQAHAGAYRPRLDALGIGARSVALKLWQVQCEVTRQECVARDWLYLSSPESFRNNSGFLAEKGLRSDPTHGNYAFGEEFACSILAYIEGRKV